MTVNNLRKSSNDEEMITVAKTLIKTWKKFVPENDTKKPAVKEDSREREQERKSEKQSKSVASSRPSFSGDEVINFFWLLFFWSAVIFLCFFSR